MIGCVCVWVLTVHSFCLIVSSQKFQNLCTSNAGSRHEIVAGKDKAIRKHLQNLAKNIQKDPKHMFGGVPIYEEKAKQQVNCAGSLPTGCSPWALFGTLMPFYNCGSLQLTCQTKQSAGRKYTILWVLRIGAERTLRTSLVCECIFANDPNSLRCVAKQAYKATFKVTTQHRRPESPCIRAIRAPSIVPCNQIPQRCQSSLDPWNPGCDFKQEKANKKI